VGVNEDTHHAWGTTEKGGGYREGKAVSGGAYGARKHAKQVPGGQWILLLTG